MRQIEGLKIKDFESKIGIFFKEKPIKKAYLFGSYAENKAKSGSDIDILVELDSTKMIGMIEYIKMIDGLEAILHKKVDLVTTDGLSSHIKPFVDKNKILIYEA